MTFPHHKGIDLVKRKSVERRDIKAIKLKNAMIPLFDGQYFRETNLEFQVYSDIDGKISAYPKTSVRGFIRC